MTSGQVDTYFVATNYEETDMDANDDTALCRFEFFEILVRIAKGKYIDLGYMDSLSMALEKLIKTHVL